MDDSPSSGRLWHSCGYPTVPRGPVPFGTQVSCLQGPISPSGTPGGGGSTSSAVIVHGPGYGHRAAHTSVHFHSCIGGAPGQVPEECFPHDTPSRGLTDPRRISFASGITILGGEPPLEQSPDILIHDPVCPDITEADKMDIVSAERDVPIPVLRPPPGFRQFSWPRGEWRPDGDPSLFNFSKELPGWFPWGYGGQSVDPPSLPILPILQDSLDDSVVANVGSSREESSIPSEAVIATQTVVDALPVGMDSGSDVLADSSSPNFHRPFSGSPVSDLPNYLTGRVGRRSPGLVPHWRLAREGPFLAEC